MPTLIEVILFAMAVIALSTYIAGILFGVRLEKKRAGIVMLGVCIAAVVSGFALNALLSRRRDVTLTMRRWRWGLASGD